MPITDSPLRYPGGKTKLYPTVKSIIDKNFDSNNCTYVEPFAGGAGLALKLLFNHDVEKIILNDFDPGIYSFWHSILTKPDQFCGLIDDCKVNMDTWYQQREIYAEKSIHTELEIAFAAFFLNRCNVSGIIQGGPIGGHNQTGTYLIDARFNKKKLIEKVRKIEELKDSIEIHGKDASDFLTSIPCQNYSDKIIFNIDPPYVKKGPTLYENCFNNSDHASLSKIIKTLPSKWIVTYDEHPLIHQLYSGFRMNNFSLQYSAGKSKLGTELIVYSNNLNIES